MKILCSLNGNIGPLPDPIMLTIESRLVTILHMTLQSTINKYISNAKIEPLQSCMYLDKMAWEAC